MYKKIKNCGLLKNPKQKRSLFTPFPVEIHGHGRKDTPED